MRCPQPIFVRKTRLHVPCGKCAACRARKANEWIIRLNEEFKASRSAYFVTLTYDDAYIPYSENGYQTLKKVELQEFINLLRQYAPFRYFAVGEYGDKGQRPHYHLIIFNFFPVVDPDSNKIVYYRDWKNLTKKQIMSNVDLEAVIYKAWKKGIVAVEPLKGGAIRYLANYLVDQSVQRPDIEELDMEKHFALMSRRPPIGYQYYDNKDVKRYHRADGEKNVRKRFKNMLDKAVYRSDTGFYALPRLYRNKLYSKQENKIIGKLYQDGEIAKIVKIKDIRKFSKNTMEANQHLEDVLKQRNKNRQL